LAEAVAGQRLDERGEFESFPFERALQLQKEIRTRTDSGFYTRWAKWFLDSPQHRTISAFSSVTMPEYVQRRTQENTLESLQEAVRLSPTNGLAFARLARQVLAQNEKANPRRVGEADFLSRRAVKLAPQDAEVAKIRAEIEERIKNLPKP
jgi:hypothetical protein